MLPEWRKIGVLSKYQQVNLKKKKTLGKPRRRCEVNIRMDLKEIGINKRNWVNLVQNRDD